MSSQRSETRTVKNNGLGYHSLRFVKKTTDWRNTPRKHFQPKQGKLPDHGV